MCFLMLDIECDGLTEVIDDASVDVSFEGIGVGVSVDESSKDSLLLRSKL